MAGGVKDVGRRRRPRRLSQPPDHISKFISNKLLTHIQPIDLAPSGRYIEQTSTGVTCGPFFRSLDIRGI